MANIRFKRFAAACVALSAAQQPAVAQVVLHEISGMAWRDRVADGIRAAHEASLGVPDHTVELRDGVTDAVVRTTTTDGDGRYLFRFGSAQPSRAYRIQTTLGPNYSGYSPRRAGNDPTVDNDIHPSGPNKGRSDSFVVALDAPARHVDIGLAPRTIAIGDFVWFDRSGDGVQGQFDPGLQGLLVEAWNPERTIRFSQTISDVDGRYRLGIPGWGPYRLRFPAPAGTSFTERHAGSDTNRDSDVIASGPDTGWTGIVTLGSTVIVAADTDAGYLVPGDGADIAIDYAEPPGVVFPGFGTSWSLRVREVLNREVESVRVRAPVPSGIQGMSWTCQGMFGATCPPAGTHALDFTVPLRFDGELHIEFAGQVTPDAASIVTASADVTVAAPQWDAFPQNNTAQLELRSDELFFNGFQ